MPIQATSYLPKPLQRLFYVLTAPGQILIISNRQLQGRGFEASFWNAKMNFQKVRKNSIFSYPISISVTIVIYDVVAVHGLWFWLVTVPPKKQPNCNTFYATFFVAFFEEKKFTILLNNTLLVSKKCVFLQQNFVAKFAALCCCNPTSSRI